MLSAAVPDDLRSDAARNRARVLQVARDLLSSEDTTLPMNTIARTAGVGVGTVYRHFPTRQALLEALALPGFERLLEQARMAAQDGDPARGLERLLRSAVTCLLADVGLRKVLSSQESACMETSQLRKELRTVSTALLSAARAARVIRADLRPDDIRRLVLGAAHAVQAGAVTPAATKKYVDVLLAGVRPSTPSQPRRSLHA